MKKILVPTDFSDQAENALKVAAQLAKKYNGEIYLLHMLEMPLHLANTGSVEALPESLFFIKLAEKRFKEMNNKEYLRDLSVHHQVEYEEIYDGIQKKVEQLDIDIIIMGSHGSSGFKEMFIGSNTEKVVRTSNIPVLVIKNEHPNFSIENFVFATDFSKECKVPFKQAQEFAEAVEAKLHLLYINTPSDFKTSEEATELMNNFVEDLNPDSYTLNIYNDTSVEKGILHFAKKSNAQLIGLSTHGRKGLSHFFNGSISEDLVNHANMPVITFKI